jgi:hypothetical protein
MDAGPTPRPSQRLLLEINRAPDGRLEGQLRVHHTDRWRPFSGVLELLKALEETLDALESVIDSAADSAADRAARATQSHRCSKGSS